MRRKSMRRSLVITVCTIVIVTLIIYNLTGNRETGEFSFVNLITQWGEVWVGLISALLIVWQLAREAAVEEAQFVTEYNRSFVENENMTDIERYLECQMSGVEPEAVQSLAKRRQNLVNYLVYLEGFSACILENMLKISDVDDLFAYRFFLALNHPEVQSISLLPFGTYYRNCYRLYEKWIDYREKCGKYSEKLDWDIPMLSSALYNGYGYENYAIPPLRTKKFDGKVIVNWNWRKLVIEYKVELEKNEKQKIIEPKRKYATNITIKKIGFIGKRKCTKMLRAALKELLYCEKVERIECNSKEVNRIWDQLVKARKILCQDGVHFRQLHSKLKISDDNLKRIAELVYHTDEYIYPDMFGSVDNAVAVLPGILRSGKDAMFNLDNLFVCELTDKIVGIILWHREPLGWTAEHLISAMEEAQLVYDEEKIRNVQREYVAGYAEKKDSRDISLLNVCVGEHVRGFGIAGKMLRAYMQPYTEESFNLCVLKKNDKAIKIYESCGFRTVGEEPAYSPNKDEMRLLMRKD